MPLCVDKDACGSKESIGQTDSQHGVILIPSHSDTKTDDL